MSNARTKVLHSVGARPNFMKVAPVVKAMALNPGRFRQVLVHTGQHYDYKMSAQFFQELHIPEPDYNLGVGSGFHGEQTGQMLIAMEDVLIKEAPDWVFVYGDTNSALATALASSKLHIPLAHVEAGLRSFDRDMPEEINRVVVDQLSDLLFTPSREANQNLLAEGVPVKKTHFVGNVMIDSLVCALGNEDRVRQAEKNETTALRGQPYVLVTLHRPANVDEPRTLQSIISALLEISRNVPVIFPVHPRTRQRMQEIGLTVCQTNFHLRDPLGYFDFLGLMKNAAVVVTDSGGIQEETSYMKIPCLTVRPNTERPITIISGTNRLAPSQSDALVFAITEALTKGRLNSPQEPLEFWDGNTSERIVDVMLNTNSRASS